MKKTTLIGMSLLLAGSSFAGGIIQWQDTSLTALYGTGFEVDPETQQTITIEHANGWVWGDFFWFNDFIYFDGEEGGVAGAQGTSTYYGEISPRLSFNKMLKRDLSVAFVKDWLIAGTYEYGEDALGEDFGIQNYLIGAGVDLDIPYFDFVQLNLYQRIPDTGDGDTVQLTAVWKYTTPAGKSHFIFDGFLDWVINSDGSYEKNLHFCPQLKFDVGTIFGWKQNRMNLGIEYDYWKNKYGIEDSDAFKTTQHAVSAIIKSHF